MTSLTMSSLTTRTAEVCDFGLSHTMEEEAVAAAQGTMGSPQWTAPEKLRGQRYDEKADSYSYGILLYEALIVSRATVSRLALVVLRAARAQVAVLPLTTAPYYCPLLLPLTTAPYYYHLTNLLSAPEQRCSRARCRTWARTVASSLWRSSAT